MIDNDLFHLEAQVEGYNVNVKIPSDYPQYPPLIVHPVSGEVLALQWGPESTLLAALMQVQSYLQQPPPQQRVDMDVDMQFVEKIDLAFEEPLPIEDSVDNEVPPPKVEK